MSDDADPNGAWCNWALRGDVNGANPSNNWSDYQGLGFDDQAVYVVPNQINFDTDFFDYAKIRILPKTTLYNTNCPAITWTDLWDLRYPQLGADEFPTFTVRPVTTFGTPGVFYLVANSIFTPPNNNFMVLYALRDPLTNPTLGADIIAMAPTLGATNADQRDGSPGVEGCPAPCLIETGFPGISGVFHNAVYREGSVWAAHTVADNTGQFARARYVRIDVAGPTLLEDGSFGLPDCWYFYPAITAAQGSNMAMVVSRSCKTTFAGLRYTTKLDGEDIGGSAVLKAGEANYVKTFGGSRNRWGDYNGIAVDPASPNRVWMFGEYAASPANTWGTWFAEVRFPVDNTPPIAFDQQTATDESTPVPIVLLADDVDGDPLTYSITSLPANADLFEGATPINAVPHAMAGDTVLYIPRGGFTGFDAFDFKANDGQADSNIATVTVQVGNTPPVADGQDLSTGVGVPLAIGLTGSDADGDPITFSVTSVPANGDLFEGATKIGPRVPHLLDGQSVLYVPRGGVSGVDEFFFTVNDGKDDSEPALINITVGPVNTPPEAFGQDVDVDEGFGGIGIDLEGFDADDDPLTFIITTLAQNGRLLDGPIPIEAVPYVLGTPPRNRVGYIPNPGFTGEDQILFKVNDGTDDSPEARVAITVRPRNTRPVADSQNVATNEGVGIGITLEGSDLDGEPLTFIITSLAQNGRLIEGPGAIQTVPHTLFENLVLYMPDEGFVGADEFQFVVNDGNVDSEPAIVNITVHPAAPHEYTVRGTVELQGMPNPIMGARVTFSTNPTEQHVFTDPLDGSFEVRMTGGTYNVTIEKDGFLPAMIDGLVVDRDVILEATLLWGDIDGNGLIDVDDLVFPAMNQGQDESPLNDVEPEPPPPLGDMIAFESDRDGNFEIYVMNADGTGQTRLTNHPAADRYPAWSPDGAMIAFTSGRDGNEEIYVMNADGTGKTRLTDSPVSDSQPSWSPDGAMIAFSSRREIYVMNADGTNPVPLTNTGLAVLESWPAWSPDGAMIVWSSWRDDHNGRNSEIYVMNADGTGQTRLTFNDENDDSPDWSADGSKIIFHSRRDPGNAELYVMNPDGSNQVNLTNSPEIEQSPDWSHDGAMIAFHAVRDIWVMNADASGRMNLTNNPANDFNPTWAPMLAPPPPPPPFARIDFFGARAQEEPFRVPQGALPDIDPGPLLNRTQGVKGHDRSGPAPQEPFSGSVAYLHLSSPQPGTAPYAMSSIHHEGFESLGHLGPERLSFDFQGTNMLTGNIIRRHNLDLHDPMSLDDPLFDILDNVVYFIEEGTERAMEKRTYVGGTWSIINNADGSVITTGTIEYITLFLDYSTEENTGWGLVHANPGSAFYDELTGTFSTDSLMLTIHALQSPVFNDEPLPLILRNPAGYAVFSASVSVSPAEAPG